MKAYNGFTPTQRQRAFNWYKFQLETGARVKPDECEACGQTEGVNGHSEDYSAPYGDHIGKYALCYCCHMAVHNRKNDALMWGGYKAMIHGGYRFRPISNWMVWKDLFLYCHELNGPADLELPPINRPLEEIEAWQSLQTSES